MAIARLHPWIVIIALCQLREMPSVLVNSKAFEYELPNRTVTICPTYSLISLECPQISASLDHHTWQPNLPQYFISIDYIRSFPSLQTSDVNSCQPDLVHTCDNYDLRYLNTLCNGKPHCPDIPAYQIRDRSLCAFKAVTEIGYHCVPTWHLNEIQTKCDICKNGSLTNDYGFIYSRNYPSRTVRASCFTTIFARPNHKTILYFVNGELNYDHLRIESVTSEGLSILNITLNGNLSTQRLAASTYEMKITFLPSHVYSNQATYYLLYFYTIPLCSVTEPCVPPATTPFILPTVTTTVRQRVQSIGWSRVQNIWIVIPIVLAYVLLLLLIIVLALFFQRRRKRQKRLEPLEKNNLAARYLDTSGTTSRTQLVTPYPPAVPPLGGESLARTQSIRYPLNGSQTLHYPTQSFAQNFDRYHRESRSDQNLPRADYRPYPRGYDTIDYAGYQSDAARRRQRRPLPKSFSDCDLCKRRVFNEEYSNYASDQEHSDTYPWRESVDREESTREPRTYREKIKERFRERLTVRHIPDNELLPSSNKPMDYSASLPQRATLPFEYQPTNNANHVRTVEYQRNAGDERLMVGNQLHSNHEDLGPTNFTVKFYQNDNERLDPRREFVDRSFRDAKEVQEMSMRMNETPSYSDRYPYYPQQTRRFNGNM